MCGPSTPEQPTQQQAPQVNSSAADIVKERTRAALLNIGSLNNIKTTPGGVLSPGARVRPNG